jgi:type III secretion protein Q
MMHGRITNYEAVSIRKVEAGVAAIAALIGAEAELGQLRFALTAPEAVGAGWLLACMIGDIDPIAFDIWLDDRLLRAWFDAAALPDRLDLIPDMLRPLLIEALLDGLGATCTGDHDIYIRAISAEMAPVTSTWMGLAITFAGVSHCGLLSGSDRALIEIAARLSGIKPRSQPMRWMAVPMVIELARVSLPLSEIKAAHPGDLFSWPGASHATKRITLVAADRWRWRIRWPASGYDDKNWEIVDQMTVEQSPPAPGGDEGLDAMPVELRFEIGRASRPLSELETWHEGSIITLPEATIEDGVAVSIVANGTLIGAGELVRIGNEAGIRIRWIGRRD